MDGGCLEDCSPWGCYKSDTTEQLHFHFIVSCIGGGNGNPLQFLAWRIPGTGEPGGLPSMGSHRVGHDWSDLAAAAAVAPCGGAELHKVYLQKVRDGDRLRILCRGDDESISPIEFIKYFMNCARLHHALLDRRAISVGMLPAAR